MSRARILYVATEDWYFLSDTLPLACAAKAAGHDVWVATRANGSHEAIIKAGLNFTPLARMSRSGIGALSESRSIGELRRIYRRIGPDLVHHIALKPILYGAVAARGLASLATVNSVMGLGYVFTSDSLKAGALRPFMALALRHALSRPRSMTIVQNSDDLAAVSVLAPAAGSKFALVRGSGVDHRRFAPVPEPEGDPVVVLPGRLLRDKGVYEFVAAARLLKNAGVRARLALVGEPDAGNRACVRRDEIARWVCEGTIEHWGFRSDMPEVYRAATLVCLPSYREGLPRVLIEAAACGRALVATNVPGCREAVLDGENGWLVPPRDTEALARALKAAILDPLRRREYAAAGRALVEAHFTADKIIAETLDIYARLLAAR